MSQKEAIAKAPVSRVRRTPVGRRNVLTVEGKDPNYVYRVVNDRGNRIEQFQAAGYEICDAGEIVVGDKRVGKPTAEGSLAQVAVGQGDTAYVMKIKKEWNEEDQAAKQRALDAQENATKQSALSGTYGELRIERS